MGLRALLCYNINLNCDSCTVKENISRPPTVPFLHRGLRMAEEPLQQFLQVVLP